MTKVLPVILCGGAGTRLWPLSRTGLPKQFLALSDDGSNRSLFQQGIKRVNAVRDQSIQIAETIVVTNEDYRFLALDQLSELQDIKATVLLETVGKNTAPALTLAALYALDGGDDPVLLVVPADQAVANEEIFINSLKKGIAIAKNGAIVILGVTPNSPETGYGYIKIKDIYESNDGFLVDKFIEKPSIENAKLYFTEGEYFWNSGIFLLKASVWLEALAKFRNDILVKVEKSWELRSIEKVGQYNFVLPNREIFQGVPSESIDYAVIENCSGANQEDQLPLVMVTLDAGWSDLGAWDAVWKTGKKDANGNLANGDVMLEGSRNSLIYASSRLVATVGIDNLVIVETPDAVLVANRENGQDVKKIVVKLNVNKRAEKNLHRKVSRPWGWYDSIDEGDCFKVKRIQVKPGASLSLQMHHYRAEHWIVVRGTAEITNGDQVITLSENQSTYIPKGRIHRLKNPGVDPLEIIEVQSGTYLGEDDIVRLEDIYGRN